MELTEITFKKGQIKVNMEENAGGSYSISIRQTSEDNSYGDRIADFRTDEVNIDDIIEVLQFCKNYNFIQEPAE